MIKLQPFKIAMPAGSRATPWADAILQVDCVGRRAFWFNGGLGYESPRIRRQRNANFKHANRPGENQNAERIRTLPESIGRLYFGVDWATVRSDLTMVEVFGGSRGCGKSRTMELIRHGLLGDPTNQETQERLYKVMLQEAREAFNND